MDILHQGQEFLATVHPAIFVVVIAFIIATGGALAMRISNKNELMREKVLALMNERKSAAEARGTEVGAPAKNQPSPAK